MRVSRPLLLVCFIGFVLAVPISAQTTSTATSDPQAVALLQKSLAALTNGAQVTDVTLTGSARRIAGSDDETGSATLEATSAGDSRVEFSFASGTRVEIRNHSALPLLGALPPHASASFAQTPQAVGERIGPDGSPRPMASHNVMTDPAWFFPALTLTDLLSSQNYVLAYIGQETHNDSTVLHVSAYEQLPAIQGPPGMSAKFAELPRRLTEMDFYIDPNSFLPVALDFNTHPDHNALLDIPVEIRFSGYQTLNGIAVPMDVQKLLNNSLVLDVQLSNVSFNSGLSDSVFTIE